MSNVISLAFHQTKRATKDEIIAIKNTYLRLGPIERAQRRMQVDNQIALAATEKLQAYFILIRNAYQEVDENV